MQESRIIIIKKKTKLPQNYQKLALHSKYTSNQRKNNNNEKNNNKKFSVQKKKKKHTHSKC